MRFRLHRYKSSAAVRAFHGRYGSLQEGQLGVLWRLFLREELPPVLAPPSLEALRQLVEDRHGYVEPPDLAEWLKKQFPEPARLELQVFRGGAFYHFIEAAALRVEGREELSWVRRLLQRLGGRLARLKNRPDREAERQALSREMDYQQTYQRVLPRWPKVEGAQLWWHLTIVRAYEYLPGHGTSQRVSPEEIQRLCQWLSVPEIGLCCTPAVIKAARRRFVPRSWFGQSYPTYVGTPRKRTHVQPAPSADRGEEACGEAQDRITFRCHLCESTQTGTLRELGFHLQQRHGKDARKIELSEQTREIRHKDTGQVLVSWDEMGPEWKEPHAEQ